MPGRFTRSVAACLLDVCQRFNRAVAYSQAIALRLDQLVVSEHGTDLVAYPDTTDQLTDVFDAYAEKQQPHASTLVKEARNQTRVRVVPLDQCAVRDQQVRQKDAGLRGVRRQLSFLHPTALFQVDFSSCTCDKHDPFNLITHGPDIK